jgi:hypothetical protein
VVALAGSAGDVNSQKLLLMLTLDRKHPAQIVPALNKYGSQQLAAAPAEVKRGQKSSAWPAQLGTSFYNNGTTRSSSGPQA